MPSENPMKWARMDLTIKTQSGDMSVVGYATPAVPGLAVVQKLASEDGETEWSVTHTASGYAISPRPCRHTGLERQEEAVAYLIGLRHVTDWTRSGDDLAADHAVLMPKIRDVRETVFGTGY